MTVHAAKFRPDGRIGMAFGAVCPGTDMPSGIDRKILRVVIGISTCLAGWMAKITIGTVISIAGNTIMPIIRVILIMLMAAQAGE